MPISNRLGPPATTNNKESVTLWSILLMIPAGKNMEPSKRRRRRRRRSFVVRSRRLSS
ncbi:unnamed protein product [Amoebophrya sp. A120]|nr:unnamed protein product [Amoebophrya sp. A120]|eukprot:GSA120T00007523001.1